MVLSAHVFIIACGSAWLNLLPIVIFQNDLPVFSTSGGRYVDLKKIALISFNFEPKQESYRKAHTEKILSCSTLGYIHLCSAGSADLWTVTKA